MGAPEDAGKGQPILETVDRAFATDGMWSQSSHADPGGFWSNALLNAGQAEGINSLFII